MHLLASPLSAATMERQDRCRTPTPPTPPPKCTKLRSPGKPNQRKGQNEKFMNFALFCEFWCFPLGKQARFTLNFCSGMPLRKVHELTFLWFGLPGPLLINPFCVDFPKEERTWGFWGIFAIFPRKTDKKGEILQIFGVGVLRPLLWWYAPYEISLPSRKTKKNNNSSVCPQKAPQKHVGLGVRCWDPVLSAPPKLQFGYQPLRQSFWEDLCNSLEPLWLSDHKGDLGHLLSLLAAPGLLQISFSLPRTRMMGCLPCALLPRWRDRQQSLKIMTSTILTRQITK